MTTKVYPKGAQGFLDGSIDFNTGVLKAYGIKGYTYSDTHTSVSDLLSAGATVLSTTVALTTPTVTDGVASVDNFTFTAVTTDATGITAIVIVQSSAPTGGSDVADASKRLISFYDGKVGVTCAAAASTSATSIRVDPLDSAITNGSTVVFGAVTATLTSGASANDRVLLVSAISGGISEGATGISSAQGN